MSQRIQFRLRHLLIVMTVLCGLLAVAVVSPWVAFLIFVFVVGSAMARLSTRSRQFWIVGPTFALLGGFAGFILGDFLFRFASTALLLQEPNLPILFCAFFPPIFGVVCGGWCGGWVEHKVSSI